MSDSDQQNSTTSGREEGQAESTSSAINPEAENELLSAYLFYIIAAVSAALLFWRIYVEFSKYIRRVSCLSNDCQRYFAQTSTKTAFFKRNILYAPIFSKRHNREFQLSSAINVGTLPTRLQLFFLVGYFSTNVAFCVINVPWSDETGKAYKVLRNRTGTLSVVNMIPLFVMAGRNNPLVRLLNISFDTFNLLHRWFGRIVILEAVAHTLSFLAGNAATGSWADAIQTTLKVPFLMYGFIATCAFVALGLQASSALRHAFYETFKLLHIGLAVLAIITLWFHLKLDDLTQLKWLIPVVPIWVADRLCRFLRIIYHNIGAGGSRTLVEALPGNACRVTIAMARPWTFKPGQHAYLYMPTISLWQSHPFSVAWSEDSEDVFAEKQLPVSRGDVLSSRKSSMSFIIRARTGFTDTLYRKAAACPDGRLVTTCFAEGPYGGRHTMHSHGTVMLFAGGVGITQAVPHVRDLVAGYSNGTVAARKIVLVWIIQSPEHLEWIRPWMTEILAMDKRRECLRILLFVSRPRSTKEIHSPSATVQMFPGRPNVETLIGMEIENQVGAMGVAVCGPGALSDSVRAVVRSRQYSSDIDFVEEAFTVIHPPFLIFPEKD
ncbi:ferric-chelate reductase [Zalerion maritima]|uniref:ferric-chelate reductase (NADPH) n=1 Tax=Zalerion maritima TaxID=339359 RepID=A0AAD5RUV9_9PEZI|nr:ferric-chelate reductase [Zalerion maritima]